jgi:hypothetical protein
MTMSDSAALESWRSRARDGGSGGRRPSTKAVFWATAAVLLSCAVLGGRALNGERTAVEDKPPVEAAPQSRVAEPPPCAAVATAPRDSNALRDSSALQDSNALQDSSALHADVDGDGCDDTVAFADGVLTAGRRRLRVGAPGDQLAVGRWTCGTATVALLRPATGEVFRFDAWATPTNAVSAVALGRVGDAVDVRAAPRSGGPCDDLVVTRTSGPPVLLPERPVAG